MNLGRLSMMCGCLLALLAVRAAHGQPYGSVQELWAGVDPRRDPLEIESVREWTEEGLHFQQLHFTGEVFEGHKVRVYAIQGAPSDGKKLPGVLHIHGGGQTVSLDWVRFWAKRGYVCVSFDYCGDWRKVSPERTAFTDYGGLPYDMAKVSGAMMKPDARHNPNWHWTLLARRALTLLEKHPQVDASRLGIFGISVGGSLTWLVAGTDERVKAAVPIYGCGWNTYILPEQTEADPVDEDTRLTRGLVSPEAYAPLVKCPVLFMDATNDFHGNMDRSFATLARVPTPDKRQVYTPRYNHHIEPGEGKDLPLWMEHWLKGGGTPWPQTPGIKVAGGQSQPRIEVTPSDAQAVTEVQIYYALNNPWPQSRFWREPEVSRPAGGAYIADAPFLAADDVIYAFANVTYASGIRLSSVLVRTAVRDLPGVKPTLRWSARIDEMRDFRDWRYGPAYTDPCIDSTFFRSWEGPGGERGFTLNAAMWGGGDINFEFGTNKLNDPQWRGRERDSLLLDYDAGRPVKNLRVKVVQREWQPTGHEFTMSVEAPASRPSAGKPDWQTLRITPDQLKDRQGSPLPDWREVDVLTLTGVAGNSAPPLFRNLRWDRRPE